MCNSNWFKQNDDDLKKNQANKLKITKRIVHNYLGLPKIPYEIHRLRLLDRLTYSEIAEILDIPKRKVKQIWDNIIIPKSPKLWED